MRQVPNGQAALAAAVASGRLYWPAALGPASSSLTLAAQNALLNLAVPSIARDLNVGIPDVSLVILGYLVTVTAALILGGRLGDLFDPRRVFLCGIGVYIIASAACALAPNLPTLLAARLVHAVGGALIVANQFALITRAASPARRGQAISLSNMMAHLGQVGGPIIGGLVTDALGWRALFLLGIPPTLATLVIGSRYLPSAVITNPRPGLRQLDLVGAALFAVSISTLMLAVNRGANWGLASLLTVGLVMVGVTTFGAFVVRELRTPEPMLDLTLFSNPPFTSAVICAIASFITTNGIVFLVPFFLIEQQGLTAAQAATAMAPMPVAMFVTVTLGGWLSDRFGPRWPATSGLVILALAAALFATMPGTVSGVEIAARLVLAGIGSVLFATPNVSTMMGNVAAERMGVAGGIAQTARYVGWVSGVALAGTAYVLAGGATGTPSPEAFMVAFGTLGVIALAGAALNATSPRVGRN